MDVSVCDREAAGSNGVGIAQDQVNHTRLRFVGFDTPNAVPIIAMEPHTVPCCTQRR